MTTALTDVALLASGSLAGSILAKATLAAIVVLLIVRVTRCQRAALRHAVLAAGFVLLLALPLAVTLGERVSIEVPVRLAAVAQANTEHNDWFLTPAPLPAPLQVAVARGPVDLRFLLFTAWGLGVAISLLPVAAGLLQMRRYRRGGVPLRRELVVLRQLADRLGVRRPVTLLRHESIAGPMTYGVMQPVIFLPRDSRHWDSGALSRALIHELEHVRRGDWIVHCASRIVCALYWFHPLAWVMWRRLALEAERSCDDAVLQESEATQYADQLVDLAERLSVRRQTSLLAMAGRDELAVRVAAVLDPTLSRGRAGRAGVVAFALGVALLVAIAPLRAVSLSLPAGIAPIALPRSGAATPADDLAFAVAAQPAALPLLEPAAQAPVSAGPALSFAVASVKVNTAGPRAGGAANMGGVGAPPSVGGRFVRSNIPVDVLIAQAYGPLQRFEIDQVPEWAANTRVDIDARADGAPTPADLTAMLQLLLAERFNLVVHREARPQDIYNLVTARAGQLGPQLKPHDPGACGDPATTPPAGRIAPDQPLPVPACGGVVGAPALGRLRISGRDLDTFGRAISGQLGRMVFDRTGLSGTFDMTVEWTPLQQLPGVTPADVGSVDRPSIFTAVQEQLGLRLEPAHGPVNMLVIDRLTMPTEN